MSGRVHQRERPPIQGEEWRPVVGWEGYYEVSNIGRVWSEPRAARKTVYGGRLLRPCRSPKGYMRVELQRGRVIEVARVHRLVLEAFVCPRPPGLICRHLDGVPHNNNVANLAWGTPKENFLDRVRHGTVVYGEAHGKSKISDEAVDQIVTSQLPPRELAVLYGISYAYVRKLRRGEALRGRRALIRAGVEPRHALKAQSKVRDDAATNERGRLQ